jgi:nitric oxide reductase activation protein
MPSGTTRPFHGGVVPDVEDAARRELERRAGRIQRALDARGIPASLREIMRALEVDPDLSDRALEQSMIDGFREGLRRGENGPDGSRRTRQGEPDTGVVLHRYPEWDEQIGDYRPRWTTVWERRAEGNAGAFVDAVLAEHGPMVAQLRREFQMLRPTGLARERRTPDGDELDLDALVADLVDRRVGLPADGRVYQRRRYSSRDVAVAFLVDLSASTRESVGDSGKSVIEVEKESLVLMCEALEALGDRYGIFGFSGRGRQMVTFDVFKDFDERYNDDVKGRIGAMTYRMENRDGAAIRHATQRLMAVDARSRLLILLSDGKPLDCGCDLYQASYAQADTRTALREARAQRIHPFCITVDPQGEDYLEEMYGAVRYAVIDSVSALPARLPAIYRRLTT